MGGFSVMGVDSKKHVTTQSIRYVVNEVNS
jgi:hypothetical protein